jgi:hypothetical protein
MKGWLKSLAVVPLSRRATLCLAEKEDESCATDESLRLDSSSSSWRGSDGKTCLAVVPLRKRDDPMIGKKGEKNDGDDEVVD